MSAVRGDLGSLLLRALVAAATTWAALTAWRGFVHEPSSYLMPIAATGVAIAMVGATLRRLGTPALVTVLVQLAVAAMLVTLQITGSAPPFGATADELADHLRSATETARLYAAPISPEAPPVAPLLILSGTAFVVLVDVVACTLRRVPGAGLALLAIYSVPSGLLAGGPGWLSFLAAAVGFLVLLHLDAREQLLAWGRPLGPDERSPWSDANPLREAVRGGAGRIGVTATALALLLPAFIPVLDVDLLGVGTGGGDGEIRIRKPIADMRRDLERGVDRPLVRISTDDPRPSYLRVAVLNRYTGAEWSSGDRAADSEDRATGSLSEPPGLSASVPRVEHRYEVEATSAFDSSWLPTYYPASSVRAAGDWRYDPATLDFLAADDDLDTRGLTYEMTALALDYGTDGAFFRDAPEESVSEEVLRLPSGVPPIARDLARTITSAAINDYERALLLQRWFRRDGNFRYDLRAAPSGTGNDTLASFLDADGGRVGYCEQFASAMAVMARVLGIPARVAIGFLEPTPIGPDRWEYSSHDLHAWPELYFRGAGWVRFEPTPAGRAESVPDYSRVAVDAPGAGDPSAAPTATDTPTGGPTSLGPTATPTSETDPGHAGDAEGSGGAGRTVLTVLVVLLALLAVAALVVVGPRAARDRSRRARLAGGPDEVWAELRATATDLGVPWPDGRSPREVGEVVVDHLADPAVAAEQERPRTGPDAAPEATDALDRLVVDVERARYGRPGAVLTRERSTLATDAQTVVAALEAGATRHARQRARWLPRSLWGR